MELKEPNFNSKGSDLSFLEDVGIETSKASSAYIITYTPYFKNVTKRELQEIDNSVKVRENISHGISLVTSEKQQGEFLNEINSQSPIFLKHMMPVMDAGIIEKDLDIDKEILLKRAEGIVEMKPRSKFAVQCRVVGGNLKYSAKDLEVYIGNSYYNKGHIPTFSDREILNEDIYVISILIHDDKFFMGFSKSTDNLNFHSDEARISSRAGGREISRAENKLIEALATFNIELDGEGIALDLGAAPGGWSKVLADYGYNVLAVDPAELHPKLQDHPKIKHLKIKSQEIKLEEKLDLIVNDMNMGPQETAKIMNENAHLLKDGGLAIITLKLPNRARNSIKESVKLLEENYEVLNIRSLYHNRQEVTALLRKKEK